MCLKTKWEQTKSRVTNWLVHQQAQSADFGLQKRLRSGVYLGGGGGPVGETGVVGSLVRDARPSLHFVLNCLKVKEKKQKVKKHRETICIENIDTCVEKTKSF